MFGYEGTDVFEVIKNVSYLNDIVSITSNAYPMQSKTKRCYTYTGQEKDGFFYPLHVATESGHKNLTILLVKAGAEITLCDYR